MDTEREDGSRDVRKKLSRMYEKMGKMRWHHVYPFVPARENNPNTCKKLEKEFMSKYKRELEDKKSNV